jgi:hypothetical protein
MAALRPWQLAMLEAGTAILCPCGAVIQRALTGDLDAGVLDHQRTVHPDGKL